MSNQPIPAVIRHLDAGLESYSQCLDRQHIIHRDVSATPGLAVVITVQHTPVITLGKNADHTYVLSGKDWLKARGIDLIQTDRGGEVTAHEPGQLVVYPILKLIEFGLSPRKYVALLEETIIEMLAQWGILSAVDPDHPGVWVGENKICAVGVRIKDRVTMHGIALNICNDLDLFRLMVPCGIVGRGVTSIARELPGLSPSFEKIRDQVVVRLIDKLNSLRARGVNRGGQPQEPQSRLQAMTPNPGAMEQKQLEPLILRTKP